MKIRNLTGFFLLFLLLTFSSSLFSQEEKKEEPQTEKFVASDFILDHIADSHEWHILTRKNGKSVSIYLPVIIYSKDGGLSVFSSKRLSEGNEYKGYKLVEEGELKGKIVSVDKEGKIDEKKLPLDLSITKTVVGMFSAALIGL